MIKKISNCSSKTFQQSIINGSKTISSVEMIDKIEHCLRWRVYVWGKIRSLSVPIIK